MNAHHERSCAVVIERLGSTLDGVVPGGALETTVNDLLDGVHQTFLATRAQDVLAIHLPLAFAPSTDAPEADDDLVGVAAACTALYVGARLLDDLMDGHDVSYFANEQSALDVLGWATFLSIVPPLILSRLVAPARTRVRVIDDLAVGMAQMAAGQLGDVASPEVIPSPAVARGVVGGKTGALLATFVKCGARVGALDDSGISHIERYGYALGVGRQLRADTAKLAPSARRVDRWSPTYLVALHAATLTGAERVAFDRLAAQARTDPSTRTVVADALTGSGVHIRAGFEAELEFASALAAIKASGVDRLTADRLEDFVEHASAVS